MATADLSRKATLETMLSFDDGAVPEAPPGSEPTTAARDFVGRNGYDPAFLNGWRIDLPLGLGAAAADMRELRRGGSGIELKYRNFSVIMSESRRLPMITATNIDGTEGRNPRRVDVWGFDGRLDKTDQFGEELYNRNRLDRGHMVRRLDPVWGTKKMAEQANADTFHFTNACPQKDEINQGIWNELEDHILINAQADGMRVNVYTGPFFSDVDLPHESGALIPLEFWKVVAIVTEDGRPSATAYTVSQEAELDDLEIVFGPFMTFQVSIQQVIDRAHVDFRPLVEYDGFSAQEQETGEPMVQPLESLEQIRV